MSSPLLLITGTTGFIGAETLYQALEKGYRARVTVRKAEQIPAVKARYPAHADSIEFAVVPEIDDIASLKPALQGVEYVLHIASPMPHGALDLQTGYIDPAVKGTLAVLEAAQAVPSIKRVVITASLFSLAPLDLTSRNGLVIEEGSNPSIVVDLKAPLPEGRFQEVAKYQISKILAHRATLEWVADKTPAFDVVTVHPYYVIGHDRTQAADGPPRGVNALFYNSLLFEKPLLPSALVDVRDVAATHVGAVTAANLKPRGQVTEVFDQGPRVTWDEIAAFVRKSYPTFPIKLQSEGANGILFSSDTTRASRDFGTVFHAPLDTFATLLDQNHAVRA